MNPVMCVALVPFLLAESAAFQEPTTRKQIVAARVKLAERDFDDASRSIDQAVAGDASRPVAVSVDAVIAWSTRWLDAELDLAEDSNGKSLAVRKHTERLRKHLGRLEKVIAEGRVLSSQLELDSLNYAIESAKTRLPTDPIPLADARVEIARRAFRATDQAVELALSDEKLRGNALNLEEFVAWSIRWMNAARDASKTGDARKSAVDDHVARIQTRKIELEALAVGDRSGISQLHVDLLNYATSSSATRSQRRTSKRLPRPAMNRRGAFDTACRMLE